MAFQVSTSGDRAALGREDCGGDRQFPPYPPCRRGTGRIWREPRISQQVVCARWTTSGPRQRASGGLYALRLQKEIRTVGPYSRQHPSVLEWIFSEQVAADRTKRQFAGYIVLDALIGNTDRHHENWGLLVERTKSGVRGFLAPTFDHASSLGRELRDEKREARLREGTIGRYSERGRGGIFWGAEGRHGPSPLELVRQAVRKYPKLFRPAILRVCEHGGDLEDAIRRVPECWMSKTAKDFAASLIRYNASEIKQCLK